LVFAPFLRPFVFRGFPAFPGASRHYLPQNWYKITAWRDGFATRSGVSCRLLKIVDSDHPFIGNGAFESAGQATGRHGVNRHAAAGAEHKAEVIEIIQLYDRPEIEIFLQAVIKPKLCGFGLMAFV
jgi:hypothetical protein